nr:DUF2254 family protein [Brevibacterium sp.]
MWGVPLRLMLIALVLGLLMPFVDRMLATGFDPYPDLDSDTVAGILGTIAGATMTLSGLVFGALSAAMSFGVTALSVRIVPVFQQDTVIRWGMGLFIATFVYSLSIAVSIAIGEDGYEPLTATALAVLAALGCAVMLLAVIVRVCQHLNPAILLRRLSTDGFRGMRNRPTRFHLSAADVTHGIEGPGHVIHRTAPLRHGDTLLAVNTGRIVDLERLWNTRIQLIPHVGTAVQRGGPVFRTGVELIAGQQRTLMRTVAFGDTYSPDSGPYGALRSMSDIALKALSPAVNDPTRAVQALDQIEDILATLSPQLLAEERDIAASPNPDLIRSWTHSWEDCVRAATDEIRQFATTSAQVQRRLRALFTSLRAQCPPVHHPALEVRLQSLDRGVDRWWTDPLDRDLAAHADPQGL